MEEAAVPLLEQAQGIVNVVQAAASEWSGLVDAYRAPEAAELVAAFGTPTRVSEGLRAGLATVFRALMGYADSVRELNRRRGVLLEEIEDFRRRTRLRLGEAVPFDGVPETPSLGSSHGKPVALELAELRQRVSSLAAEHEQAEQDCARQIGGVRPVDVSVPVYYDGGTVTDFAVERTRSRLKDLESAEVAGATGALEMLELLGTLTPGQLLDYGMAESDFLRSGFSSPPPVGQVKDWWAGLSSEQQAALLVAAPGVITPDENGKPLVTVAIGDLDTATNVTWNAPGMKTTVADGLESWTKSAQDLYRGAGACPRNRGRPPGRGCCVVDWL